MLISLQVCSFTENIYLIVKHIINFFFFENSYLWERGNLNAFKSPTIDLNCSLTNNVVKRIKDTKQRIFLNEHLKTLRLVFKSQKN